MSNGSASNGRKALRSTAVKTLHRNTPQTNDLVRNSFALCTPPYTDVHASPR